MKPKNLILGIALVGMTTIAFGQRSSFKERVFNKQNNHVEYITADYSMNETSRMESWMNTPFESSIAEEDISLESWMTAPFEAAQAIEVEAWMTTVWI